MSINKESIQSNGDAWATLRRQLASRGGRLTPQRMAIYDAVVGRTTHPSVQTVYAEVRRRFPGLSPATVYATLDLFAHLGLIQEISGPVRRYDGRASRHVNLVCQRCGRVIDVPDRRLRALERTIARRVRFRVRAARFELHGVCARCRRRPAPHGEEV
jgi:Fur family peroxide stress response transcriptional regulator